MPATSALTDCQRLATAVTDAGGRIPDTLGHLLSGAALLNAHRAAPHPAKAIVDAAVAGELTEKRLNDLIVEAATAQMIASYRGELRRDSERMFVTEFHTALKNGAADELLDSLRDRFTEAAEAIAAARDLIPIETPAEAFLRTAEPEAVTAWQQLDSHLAVIEQISRIASQFGPQLGNFPLIEPFALGEGFRISDQALWCCDGNSLPLDSQPFGRPDQGHRTSPWFKTSLRLHSMDSARARHNAWAADEFDRLHSGPQESWLGENGKVHPIPKPKNPYRARTSVT